MRRRRRRALNGALVLALLVVFASQQFYPLLAKAPVLLWAALLVSALCAFAAWRTGAFRALWHLFANRTVVAPEKTLRAPCVIDGDTIDDRATGVRYRLANIDAPETGDNARCFNERQRGELARAEAFNLVRHASQVSVRPTWRIDRFGRRVAFVLIDGEDLGRLLMARGLARPWQGLRVKWCGRSGGLARIAAGGAMLHACKTCSHWR